MKAPSSNGVSPNPMEGERRNINSELWHACAGPLISLPPAGSLVVYFPQGHSEQVAASMQKQTDFIPSYPNLPSKLICMLQNVTLNADPETEEVYAQMTLQPVNKYDRDALLASDMGLKINRQPNEFFCKTLTASDTSTHGGFSVPRRAAEKIFPALDFSMQPPCQELVAKDIHDNTWTFRHIFRGQPKRHLLTTGWSVFVSTKRLFAGDSVLFVRDGKGQLLLGIRRANRQQPALSSSVISSDSMHIGVLAAAAHANANNSPFTIFYNPRAAPAEFVVPLAKYTKAMYAQVSLGMRFRMIFETEECGVRRYMGTVTGISDLDPVRWKNSQWRNLQIGWDESAAGDRPSRVSVWDIEPVLTPFYICPPPFFRPRFAGQPGMPDDGTDMESALKRAMPWLDNGLEMKDPSSTIFPGLSLVQWMSMQQQNGGQVPSSAGFFPSMVSPTAAMHNSLGGADDQSKLVSFQTPPGGISSSNLQFNKPNLQGAMSQLPQPPTTLSQQQQLQQLLHSYLNHQQSQPQQHKGQLLLGIRRANRQQPALSSSVISSDSMHIGVLAAAAHANANNSPFTIFYNPRAAPAEFVVPLAKYTKAMYAQVSLGMRFRMIFETEECGVRRYMGTVTGISDLDPVRWKNSQWRNLQIGWDESAAGDRPSRVSVWDIEPVLTPFYICPPPFFRPRFAGQPGMPDDGTDMESALKRAMPWLDNGLEMKDPSSTIFPGLSLVQWMSMQQQNGGQVPSSAGFFPSMVSPTAAMHNSLGGADDQSKLVSFQTPPGGISSSNLQFNKPNLQGAMSQLPQPPTTLSQQQQLQQLLHSSLNHQQSQPQQQPQSHQQQQQQPQSLHQQQQQQSLLLQQQQQQQQSLQQHHQQQLQQHHQQPLQQQTQQQQLQQQQQQLRAQQLQSHTHPQPQQSPPHPQPQSHPQQLQPHKLQQFQLPQNQLYNGQPAVQQHQSQQASMHHLQSQVVSGSIASSVIAPPSSSLNQSFQQQQQQSTQLQHTHRHIGASTSQSSVIETSKSSSNLMSIPPQDTQFSRQMEQQQPPGSSSLPSQLLHQQLQSQQFPQLPSPSQVQQFPSSCTNTGLPSLQPPQTLVSRPQDKQNPPVGGGAKAYSGITDGGDAPSSSTSPSTNNCQISSSTFLNRSQSGPAILIPDPAVDVSGSLVQDLYSKSDMRLKHELVSQQKPKASLTDHQLEASASGTSYGLDGGENNRQQNFLSPNFGLDGDSRNSLFGGAANVENGFVPDTLLSRGYDSQKDLQNMLSNYGGVPNVIGTEMSTSAVRTQSFGIPNVPAISNDIAVNDAGVLGGGLWPTQTQRMRTYTKVQKRGSVGRSIDVNRYRGYDELRHDLARMFGIEGQLEDPLTSDWKLVYVDHENDILLVGDDPWEEFVNCVQSIKILSSAEVQQMSLDGNFAGLPATNQACSGGDNGNGWRGQYDDNSATSFNR
uniref:Auxin response factor n=1 Tax=Brassica campestris TaxID=3711 RepID=M4CDP6_BRACM